MDGLDDPLGEEKMEGVVGIIEVFKSFGVEEMGYRPSWYYLPRSVSMGVRSRSSRGRAEERRRKRLHFGLALVFMGRESVKDVTDFLLTLRLIDSVEW